MVKSLSDEVQIRCNAVTLLTLQLSLLQYAVFDVQLTVTACCEARIVRYDEQRFFSRTRQVQQQIHNYVAGF
jgi:hypothetical protein